MLSLKREIEAGNPLRVCLIERGGELATRYTPLAIMYLHAAVRADLELSDTSEISLHAYTACHSVAEMIEEIVACQPDVLGFSCQGWSFTQYTLMFASLRHLFPKTVFILGGNHVSGRGATLLPAYPEVDVIINGEGEQTFRELLHHVLTGEPALEHIAGLTFRDSSGVYTTAARPRVRSLDSVSSPWIEPVLPVNGYDVALLETNRGCPYACSFCYWGGAIGQKIARTEIERVAQEIDRIGEAGIPTLFICDANFGILEKDVEIAHMLVNTFRRYGAPDTLHVNWAKNHAHRVAEILDILRSGGIHTNVFLALQTTSVSALKLAGRDERGRKEMFELARRLVAQDSAVGCELIFGMPGETLEEFKRGYDWLFLEFPTVLLHPLWILPNTDYDARREELALVTIRPDGNTDYEGVLQHSTLTLAENREGLALLLAEEILVGTGWARSTLRGLAQVGGQRPTDCLRDFEAFVATRDDILSSGLSEAFRRIRKQVYFERQLRSNVRLLVTADRDMALALLQSFVAGRQLPETAMRVCLELARYDCALLPRSDLPGEGLVDSTFTAPFDVHVLARLLVRQPNRVAEWLATSAPVALTVRHRAGYCRVRQEAIDLCGRWPGEVLSADSSGRGGGSHLIEMPRSRTASG